MPVLHFHLHPAIESAHAVAYASKYAKELTEKLGAAEAKDKTMIICLSGRGDKDVNTIDICLSLLFVY